MMHKSTLGVDDCPIGELYKKIAELRERIAHLKTYSPFVDTGMLEIRLETLEERYINKISKGE